MRLDRNGIPYLNESDIERLAEEFLRRLAPSVLSRPQFTPLAEIMEQLVPLGVTFDLSTSLGVSPQGNRYLGRYQPNIKRISIDRDLSDDDPRFPFTVAHELGHFCLHSKIRPEAFEMTSDSGILDSSRDLVVHRVQSDKLRSIIEWQANRFAGGILVPRSTLPVAVEAIQKELGIRRIGTIWHDRRDDYSARDYRATLARLVQIYRVSRSVVRFRLLALGFLEEVSKEPTRLADLLGSALEGLFHEAPE